MSDLEGKRIGVFEGFESDMIDRELFNALTEAAEHCRSAGATVEPIDLPLAVKYGVAIYYVTALADASSKLACFDGLRYGAHVDGKTPLKCTSTPEPRTSVRRSAEGSFSGHVCSRRDFIKTITRPH